MTTAVPDYIESFLSSGLNGWAFCREKGICYSTFYYHWRRHLGKAVSESCNTGFVRVRVKDERPQRQAEKSSTPAVVRLFEGSKLRLEVEGRFTAAFLRELAGC